MSKKADGDVEELGKKLDQILERLNLLEELLLEAVGNTEKMEKLKGEIGKKEGSNG